MLGFVYGLNDDIKFANPNITLAIYTRSIFTYTFEASYR